MSDLLLIDGKGLYHRMASGVGRTDPARFDAPNMRADAAFAFFTHLEMAVDAESGALPIVVWEGERNWRRQLDPTYKSHRGADSPEMHAVRNAVRLDVLTFRVALIELGVRQAEPSDGEADDAMATLARSFAERGRSVTIWTWDKDMLATVRTDGRVCVARPDSTTGAILRTMQPQQVREKLGVWPVQVADMKGIAGDASDGMKGVPGLGPKAAADILERYPTLDSAIAAAECGEGEDGNFGLMPRWAKLLVEHKADALRCRRLARLDDRTELKHFPPQAGNAWSVLGRLGIPHWYTPSRRAKFRRAEAKT